LARVLRDAATDTGSGLKLFRRDAYLSLRVFGHTHRLLPALIRRGGGAVLELPVNYRPRTAGASRYGMWDRAWVGLVDMLGVAWLPRRMKNPNVEEMDES
jgi:dolichol-phosphate mannosyltransferase